MTHLLYCFPSSFHLKPTSQDYTLGPNLACLDAWIMCCESPSDIACWSLSFPSVTGKSVKTLNLQVQIHCIPVGGVQACFPHMSQAQGCRETSQQWLGIIMGRGNLPGSRSGYRSGPGGGMVSNTRAVPIPVVQVVRVVWQCQRTSVLG